MRDRERIARIKGQRAVSEMRALIYARSRQCMILYLLQGIGVLLQEGHSRLGVTCDVLVYELHKLTDEGGQLPGILPVILSPDREAD